MKARRSDVEANMKSLATEFVKKKRAKGLWGLSVDNIVCDHTH